SAGLEVDKVKINVISKLPPPTNIKGVKSFLGHAGFYRRSIKDFSKIARPITKLLEKDTPFEFDDECQKAFELLKEKLTCAPVIAFRTAYKTPTGTTPYKLIYGKNCHLPFDIEHRAYWALKNCNPELIAAGEKRMFQLHKRVPYNQRNNIPQNPRIVYPPILNINYFRHFLDILRNYDPMDDEPMWAADHVVAPTLGSAITILETANEFAIKGNHLNLVKGNQFDGRTKTDPHKHIYEFLEICDMFKYRDTENEAVHLMMFPLSLTGEAKIFFDRLLGEIRAFSQHENESLTDAWLRMKEMLRNCHGHNLSIGNIIKIFYHGLSKITQEVLNAAAGGSSNSDTDKIMARMDVMTLKMDAQYKELQSNAKKTKPDLDEDNIPMS
ncbi:hypothetical protein Tco_0519496, partial [Tanacetum coccineum]